jgi:hypothetical protein
MVGEMNTIIRELDAGMLFKGQKYFLTCCLGGRIVLKACLANDLPKQLLQLLQDKETKVSSSHTIHLYL